MRFEIGCLGIGFRLLAACCLVGLLVAACGHVPVMSMVKLSRINFQTTAGQIPAGILSNPPARKAAFPTPDRVPAPAS